MLVEVFFSVLDSHGKPRNKQSLFYNCESCDLIYDLKLKIYKSTGIYPREQHLTYDNAIPPNDSPIGTKQKFHILLK